MNGKTTIQRVAAVLFLGLILGAGNAMAQEPEEFYYGWKGEKIALERSVDTIGITFRNRVTAAELRGFVDTVGQLRRKDGEPIPDEIDLGRTVVVGTVPGLTVAAARTLNATLRGRAQVANTHAVFRVGTEKESMITDIISVIVNAGTPE